MRTVESEVRTERAGNVLTLACLVAIGFVAYRLFDVRMVVEAWALVVVGAGLGIAQVVRWATIPRGTGY